MSKGITISPKHGLNPSLDMCFWCGQPKGIILCGRVHEKKGDRTDIEAPKETCLNLDPCDNCKENFKLGVQIIEVVEDGTKFQNKLQFAIKDGNGKVVWPTGRYVVMKAESIKGGKPGTHMLCDTATMDKIFAAHDRKKAEKQKGGKEKKEVKEDAVSS